MSQPCCSKFKLKVFDCTLRAMLWLGDLEIVVLLMWHHSSGAISKIKEKCILHKFLNLISTTGWSQQKCQQVCMKSKISWGGGTRTRARLRPSFSSIYPLRAACPKEIESREWSRVRQDLRGIWCSSIAKEQLQHLKSLECWRSFGYADVFLWSCRSQPSRFVQQVQDLFAHLRHWTYLESLQGQMGNNGLGPSSLPTKASCWSI